MPASGTFDVQSNRRRLPSSARRLALIKAPITPKIQPNRPFPLLALPVELRQKIFAAFFARSRTLIQCHTAGCGDRYCNTLATKADAAYYGHHVVHRHRLAITKVSRLVRAESFDAFLRCSAFDFVMVEIHPDWEPNDLLKSYMKRMNYIYCIPRVLPRLGIITDPWTGKAEGHDDWLDDCLPTKIICDSIVDKWEIRDATSRRDGSEAKYYRRIKRFLQGPRGNHLSLRMRLFPEDFDPLGPWSIWGTGSINIRIHERRVIVRTKPYSEQGKIYLKKLLILLGLELSPQDQYIIEPRHEEESGDAAKDGVLETIYQSSYYHGFMNTNPLSSFSTSSDVASTYLNHFNSPSSTGFNSVGNANDINSITSPDGDFDGDEFWAGYTPPELLDDDADLDVIDGIALPDESSALDEEEFWE